MNPALEAIKAALNGDWKKAIELNLEIIKKDDSNSIEPYLRLGHAYFESGDSKKAQQYAKKALQIDPDSKLAKRCLEKCLNQKEPKKPGKADTSKTTNLKAFLEVPGKTMFVKLTHLGEPQTIGSLCSGEQVRLLLAPRKTVVETTSGEHIGRLPDDITAKIGSSKKATFWAAIKSATASEVSVILHENRA